MLTLQSLKRLVLPWLRAAGVSAALALPCFGLFEVSAPQVGGGVYSLVLEAGDGKLLGANIALDGQWRFPADHEIPARFVQALVATEDKRFWAHNGIDPISLVSAISQNLKAGEVRSGASTITMQLSRLLLGNPPRETLEKIREMALSLRIEWGLNKADILRLYAANAPFGGNVVGLEAASWRYFGRAPAELSWAETATLAVLPNAPALIHPGRNRDSLKQRRDRLLEKLSASGLFDASSLSASLLEPLPDNPKPLPNLAPHLLQTLLKQRKGEGGRVRSSIDSGLQEHLSQIAMAHHQRLSANGIENLAILVLRTKDASVAGYLGNVPTLGARSDAAETGGHNDLVQAKRSTGSLLKPFLYAGMLDSSELLPTQLVADVPSRFGAYTPENNTRGYAGAVPANEALSRSLNIPAVRSLRSFGVDRFYRLLKDLGMTSLFRPASEYGLPLILGGAEGSLWELCNMYGDMARSLGERGDSWYGAWPLEAACTRAQGQKPERVDDSHPLSDFPLGKGAVWLTFQAMLDVGRPDDEAAWEQYASTRRIAWKTGTSFGLRDAWSIGVTPDWVVGVWVGNADGEARPELRGSSAAAPILFDVFTSLDTGDWFAEPQKDLDIISVCADSGYLASPDCPQTRTQLVPLKALNSTMCPYCRLVHLDANGYATNAALTNPADMHHEKRFILPPTLEYYYRSSHPDYRGNPLPAVGSSMVATTVPPGIFVPEAGSVLYIPVELDGSPGKAVFQAAASRRDDLLYWHLDGEYLGQTIWPHQLEARPSKGDHVLTVVDPGGNETKSRFRVSSD